MSKLVPLAHRDFIGKLKAFGFEGPYAGGRHLYMIKGELRLTVPNPHRESIGVDLLSRILKQAGITRNEWTKR